MRVAAIQDGYTALVLAGKNGHASCFKNLLDAGADFAAFDKVRGTALVLYGFRAMGIGRLKCAGRVALRGRPNYACRSRGNHSINTRRRLS